MDVKDELFVMLTVEFAGTTLDAEYMESEEEDNIIGKKWRLWRLSSISRWVWMVMASRTECIQHCK
jgi:hypothetical protein